MDRRSFVRTTAAALAGAGTGVGIGGCATFAAVPVEAREGRIRLSLAEHPRLADEGVLKLRVPDRPTPLYLLALEQGAYATLSPVCTHQGCTVGVEGRHLVCPCHGSTYDRRGRVLRGPARRPLQGYPTRLEDGEVVVIELVATPGPGATLEAPEGTGGS